MRQEQPENGEAASPPSGYLANSRNLVSSIILVTPLFVLYQIGILVTDGWRNGVDFLTPQLSRLTGGNTLIYLGVNLAIVAVMLAATRLVADRERPQQSTWLFVLLESTLYATFLGQLIARLLVKVGLRPPGFSMSPLDNLVLSLGAGAYEELVFRLLLFSGLLWLGKKLALSRALTLVLAFGLSSLLFSIFHYRPIGTESWELWSFSFRFLAGLLFATLYLLRGFAVAAYTHAIYDIHILVL
ncbi:MAG: CPBP family intramembrane metalloprotease [Bradymonadales bacterium]|nr:CPBP family intramembrane metalloprotease [Bradymonadales bacterium]